MSIIKISKVNGYRITARVRVPNAKGGIAQKRLTIPNCTKEKAKKIFEELKEELRNSSIGSLTELKTFKDLAHYYIERKKFGGMESTINALIRDIGNVSIDDLRFSFDQYLVILKSEISQKTGKVRSIATINRYISCAKMICNFAVKQQLIEKNSLAHFSNEKEMGRDRVLSDNEELRLLNCLKSEKSYLYWAVYFSLKNPIRRGDLFSLTKENLDMFQPWIHFYPSKTRKRQNRETCLPCIESSVMEYFKELPSDCPYLFPRFKKDGTWCQVGDIKKHWHRMLKLSNIKDFRFHDLKHCAITWMIDHDFNERDLKNLGIQYTSTMIDRYYKHDATKAVKKWKNNQCENICANTVTSKGAI